MLAIGPSRPIPFRPLRRIPIKIEACVTWNKDGSSRAAAPGTSYWVSSSASPGSPEWPWFARTTQIAFNWSQPIRSVDGYGDNKGSSTVIPPSSQFNRVSHRLRRDGRFAAKKNSSLCLVFAPALCMSAKIRQARYSLLIRVLNRRLTTWSTSFHGTHPYRPSRTSPCFQSLGGRPA